MPISFRARVSLDCTMSNREIFCQNGEGYTNLLPFRIPYCLRLREHAGQNSPKCKTNKRCTFRSDFVSLKTWVCLPPPKPVLGTGLAGREVLSSLWLLTSILAGKTQCFSIYSLSKHFSSLRFLPGTAWGAGNTDSAVDTIDLALSSEEAITYAENEPQLWSSEEWAFPLRRRACPVPSSHFLHCLAFCPPPHPGQHLGRKNSCLRKAKESGRLILDLFLTLPPAFLGLFGVVRGTYYVVHSRLFPVLIFSFGKFHSLKMDE